MQTWCLRPARWGRGLGGRTGGLPLTREASTRPLPSERRSLRGGCLLHAAPPPARSSYPQGPPSCPPPTGNQASGGPLAGATQTGPFLSAVTARPPALQRQARVDGGPEGAEDPWVRISGCIRSLFSPVMSESHGPSLQPASLAQAGAPGPAEGAPRRLDAGNGAPKGPAPADGGAGKKGPPVAPKPAWFRQSLKGLRPRGPDPREPPASASRKPSPAPRAPPGPPARASGSLRQKISCFETFGCSPLPPTAALRPSLQPPRSWAEASEPPGGQEGRGPGLWGRGAPPTAEQPPPGPHAAAEAGDGGAPGTPPPGPPPEDAPSPDPLPRLLPAPTAGAPGSVLKAPGQRARSFPLTRTRSLDVPPADGACPLYALSSRVSSAVMRSLLCLPASAPGSPRDGVSAATSPGPDPAASGTDSGFSLK